MIVVRDLARHSLRSARPTTDKSLTEKVAVKIFSTFLTLLLASVPQPSLAEKLAADNTRYYRSETTTTANLPFSDAVRAGDLLYLNNQIGNRPGQGVLADGGFKGQFAQILENIDGVLAANGLTRADIVMCTVALTDMADWGELNQIWLTSFSANRLPARNAIGTTGLPLGAVVGVQCNAAYPAWTASR